MRTLVIPQHGDKTTIYSTNHFTIVGANGSGKSHLGAWIECEPTNGQVLRISAQRALSIPDNITIKSEMVAWQKLLYGDEKHLDKNYKWKWGNYTTQLVNDYDSVLSAIFARQNKENDEYVKDCRIKESNGEEKARVPIMITDRIINIWKSIFPHRNIIFQDATVLAQHAEGDTYHAQKMSDGERVAIYLIGQCLVAPDNTTIVIDEPEIHLHKSIMYKLWDKIEESCQNKTLVYITHDLDFASSRKECKKIWVKSYDGNKNWDIAIIDSDDNIPDCLLYEVLGNRKPVLFIEGERGSYDYQLYTHIYDQYHIIPCQNCHKVIEMTKAFNNERIKSLHHLKIKGIIDHDYMTEEEIKGYKDNQIHTLEVAEIENLYLIEPIIRIVAENQALEPDATFDSVKEFLFNEFSKEYDHQISEMCTKEIQHKLKCYNKPLENTIEALQRQMDILVTSINIPEVYNRIKNETDTIIENQEYDSLLKIYNRKSLHLRISSHLKLSPKEYPNLVLRLLKTEKKDMIIEAMRQYAPNIN